jgi:two-component sensor histidine kinase
MVSQPEGFKEAERRRWRPEPLALYTACVSALGVALCLLALSEVPNSYPTILLFLGLVIIAEVTTSEVFLPQISFSTSSAAIFATMLVLGPLPAALVAMVGGLVTSVAANVVYRRRERSLAPLLQRALFNMAAYGLSAAAGGAVYVLLGGTVGEVRLLGNVAPMVLAAITNEMSNAALVVGAVAIQTSRRPFGIWKENASWAAPMNVLSMLVGGGGLALGYQIAGILGLIVFFLPLALTIYAFRLYVQRAKLQMDELEQNIAERQRAEEQLRASLNEKEILLQEIHHRVKNNLQIMSSLLHLQSRLVEDVETMALFKESRNRIRSMALVHEKLYQSSDLSRINFAQYVQSLMNYLFRSYGTDPQAIRSRIDADDIHLSIDTAVPCGLLVNELISNSLEHAFPNGRKGEIRVDFRRAEEDRFLLTVSDNGVGFVPDLEADETETLGLQLVYTLTNQLEGIVEYEGQEGTSVRVEFSELAYKEQAQP